MSDAAAPAADNPLLQMMQANAPETIEDLREMLDGFAGMMNAELPEVGAFHDSVPVEGLSNVTADIVVPTGDGPWPVLVYLHGGGWVAGSPKTHLKVGHRFAEAGYLVVNVDYRMAPEHPFPTPFDDCVESIRWATKVAAQYGGDPSRLAIGGDSAGGNLSAAAAIHLADDPDVNISAALLIYGVFDFARMGEMGEGMVEGSPEMAEMGEKFVEMMVGSYLGEDRSDSRMADPRISPIHGAAKLPPSHIVCGGMDPLSAQTHTLAELLEREGVPHEKFIVDGMPHGYVQMEFFPQARESINRMIAFLDARVK
jgi:acetyl esterase